MSITVSPQPLRFSPAAGLSVRQEMIAVSYTFDANYLIESHNRFKRQRNRRMRVIIPGALAGLCLTITSIFLIHSREIVMGIIPILFVSIAVIAMVYERWSLKRQIRKLPFKGDEIEVRVSDESFDLSSSLAKTSLKWGVFTKVVHFEDGILLFESPRAYFWMPYSGLRAGNIQQLEELLRKHIPEQKFVERRVAPNDR